jgi:hypothetical protein
MDIRKLILVVDFVMNVAGCYHNLAYIKLVKEELMEKGQIVYFYYDNVIPCQKAKILEIIDGGYEVNWLNDNNRPCGNSSIPADRVFASEKECIDYINIVNNKLEQELMKNLSSQTEILKFMYNAIYYESYDTTIEKKVLRQKIKEMFNIEIKE